MHQNHLQAGIKTCQLSGYDSCNLTSPGFAAFADSLYLLHDKKKQLFICPKGILHYSHVFSWVYDFSIWKKSWVERHYKLIPNSGHL